MAYPKAMPIVEVVWIDSQMANGWHSSDDMRTTVMQGSMECRTAGYLFDEREDRVTVVNSQADNENVADAMTIPRRAILAITTLKAVEVAEIPNTVTASFPIAFDVAGKPYCADCGDSGSGPCRYHQQQTRRRLERVD